jgi:ribosomal protein L37AE/L43A
MFLKLSSKHNNHYKTPTPIKTMAEEKTDNYVCPDCKNTGIVKDPKGGAHTCWKCLQEGRLDAHSKNIPDSGIKL